MTSREKNSVLRCSHWLPAPLQVLLERLLFGLADRGSAEATRTVAEIAAAACCSSAKVARRQLHKLAELNVIEITANGSRRLGDQWHQRPNTYRVLPIAERLARREAIAAEVEIVSVSAAEIAAGTATPGSLDSPEKSNSTFRTGDSEARAREAARIFWLPTLPPLPAGSEARRIEQDTKPATVAEYPTVAKSATVVENANIDRYIPVTNPQKGYPAMPPIWPLRRRGPALPPDITLGAYLAKYQRRTHLQPRTKAFYASLVRLHFASLADRQVRKLTPADGANFQRFLLDYDVGPVTVRHCFKLARSALNEAVREGIIPANPFALLRAPKGRPADVKVPGRGHMKAIDTAAEGRVGLLLRLALASGARRNELLALTWQHVDLTAGTIAIDGALEQLAGKIRVKPTKTRAGRRTIVLPPAMVAEVRTARIAAAEVALGAGRKVATVPVLPAADGVSWWSPMAATQAARRALDYAGVPGSLHGLRHAHATALLQARINPKAVQARMGHGSISTTLATYAHAMPGDDAAAAAAIALAIKGDAA